MRTINSIDHVIVKFENYSKRFTGPTQCAKCLHYGHGASNCYMSPRCIKCGESHQSISCPRNLAPDDPKSKIPKELVKCANCGGNHTANFSKCPARFKYLEIRRLAQNKPVQKSTPVTIPAPKSTFTKSKVSYQNKPLWSEVLQNNNQDSNLLSAQECYQLFKQFINEIMKCTSAQQQVDAIARLSLEFASKYNGRR